MKRRDFIGMAGVAGGMGAVAPLLMGTGTAYAGNVKDKKRKGKNEIKADLVIAGGGMGGCAAALAACRNGLKVIMTEETDWIGGQLTQQGVPPDEHKWIETHGATRSYRDLRTALRQYYNRNHPLTQQALSVENLNPGNGWVSRICAEPRAWLAVLHEMLAPWISSGKLTVLHGYKAKQAYVNGNKVIALEVAGRHGGQDFTLTAPYFVDATELGDLLPMTGTEYVTGAESKKETGELHAAEVGDPDNQQSFTLCFAMDYVPGESFIIDKPEKYEFWKSFVPPLDPPWTGPLLDLRYYRPSNVNPLELSFHPEGTNTGNSMNLWNYRRVIDRTNFTSGFYPGDITIVNWPQNDYMLGNLVGGNDKSFNKHLENARQLNLSLFYWLQTDIPRPDGGTGWPGLRLRGDVMGTDDGMAQYPYIRESRRIKSVFTVLEEYIGIENRELVKGKAAALKAEQFFDSVGVGHYYLDLHPTTKGDNNIYMPSLPFQIPLGALIPQRIENLLPVCKNIGTTHITNGCYRLHPVEWNIGESAGMLVAYALDKKILPLEVRELPEHLKGFQQMITSQGVEIEWPE